VSTNDLDYWPDTYTDLYEAQIACIEGFRVQNFISQNFNIWVGILIQFRFLDILFFVILIQAANCGGVVATNDEDGSIMEALCSSPFYNSPVVLVHS